MKSLKKISNILGIIVLIEFILIISLGVLWVVKIKNNRSNIEKKSTSVESQEKLETGQINLGSPVEKNVEEDTEDYPVKTPTSVSQ